MSLKQKIYLICELKELGLRVSSGISLSSKSVYTSPGID